MNLKWYFMLLPQFTENLLCQSLKKNADHTHMHRHNSTHDTAVHWQWMIIISSTAPGSHHLLTINTIPSHIFTSTFAVRDCSKQQWIITMENLIGHDECWCLETAAEDFQALHLRKHLSWDWRLNGNIGSVRENLLWFPNQPLHRPRIMVTDSDGDIIRTWLFEAVKFGCS